MGEIRKTLTEPAASASTRDWMPLLQHLMTQRRTRLANGQAGEFARCRLGVTENWLFAVPDRDRRSRFLFAPAGQEMTELEAHLAGFYGRSGVDESLAMLEALLAEAGAHWRWIAGHVDLPAEAAITEEFGRGVGRPANAEDDYSNPKNKDDRDRKRIRSRIARGRILLEKYVGANWRDHLLARQVAAA